MAEHPGVVFRDGPTGRRAGLVAGPDVFEVIGAVRSARRAEPDLDESALMAMITVNTGVTRRQLQTAVTYWSAYPDDIDSTLQHAAVVEAEELLADERRRSLLRMA